MHGKVLLLSGASRGVGECVARLAVERGAAGLALVGRDTKTGEVTAAHYNVMRVLRKESDGQWRVYRTIWAPGG